ncbi:MAG: sodium/glutamate symporter [Sinobacteraceae bacterium]|nr:sodium/glutamate symporter [Nevskiaceae bacterium]
MLALDLIQTLAAGGVALFAGFAVVRWFPALARYNVPAAVIGGLLVALVILALRRNAGVTVTLDTSLQPALMTAFFTSIGFSASLALLRSGSGQALLFLALAAFLAILQGVVGIAIVSAFGEPPLLGVLISSTALTGGPATALAFAPQFAAAGVPSADSVAIAAAMSGIVAGGLAGGPIATRLLERHRLRSSALEAAVLPVSAAAVASQAGAPAEDREDEEDLRTTLAALTLLLVAMWLGSFVSKVFVDLGVTLPGYVGAMLMGALLRNLADATGLLVVPESRTSSIGAVCLTLFLTIALMNLKLWELAAVALPLIINLGVQVALVAVFCWWVVFRVMGRDYDAAVMSGGFTGFMLGTTANAMAVMRTIVERFGPAPRAFLVAPIVGAFFIDFANALIITTYLNILS